MWNKTNLFELFLVLSDIARLLLENNLDDMSYPSRCEQLHHFIADDITASSERNSLFYTCRVDIKGTGIPKSIWIEVFTPALL